MVTRPCSFQAMTMVAMMVSLWLRTTHSSSIQIEDKRPSLRSCAATLLLVILHVREVCSEKKHCCQGDRPISGPSWACAK